MGVDARRDLLALRRILVTFGSLVSLLVTPRPGWSQSRTDPNQAPATALTWSGPEGELGCLGGDNLERAVSEYLGRAAFSSGATELLLLVQVERRATHGWRALLQIKDRLGTVLGERELTSEAPLCSSLDEPLKLAVALMMDTESVPPPDREEPPVVEPAPPPPARARHARPSALRVRASGSIVGEIGLLPKLSPGLQLALEVSPQPWFSVRGSGLGFFPSSEGLAGPARAKMSLFYGGLSACLQTRLGLGWSVAACPGVAAGILFAQTSQLEAARSTSSRFLAAELALHSSVALSRRWSLLAHTAGIVPYRPERFIYVVDGQRREFFRMSALSLVAGIGCSVMF